MEQVINKPEKQFLNILNDLIDYDKNSEEKSALIEEVCRNASKQLSKPAASLNSSIYSSAASSTSSTSSASDSSANSASSSSTSSTLSSPSQNTQSNGEPKQFRIIEMIEDYDNFEVPKMEDLGKTARILEHISSEHTTSTNDISLFTASLHSDKRSNSPSNDTQRSSSTLVSQTHKLTQLNAQNNLTQHSYTTTNYNFAKALDPSKDSTTTVNSWKTINGKRDKRRRKPAEQPVLSQHIPGHRGEQEVDWLVKFIESDLGSTNNSSINSTKKNTNNKNTKSQSKRQQAQTIDQDRENQQRKTASSTNSKPTSTQTRPLLQQNKLNSNNRQIAMVAQKQASEQRALQPNSNDNQSQSKQSSSLTERNVDRGGDRKETCLKSAAFHMKRSSGQQQEETGPLDAVVTFADHIRPDDDNVDKRYTFGFFEEQHTTNLDESDKPIMKHNEKHKSNPVGQKHKMKHIKASLNSDQKRYKFNDNIDATSFNYHQILQFISNSWESTAKSHRL